MRIPLNITPYKNVSTMLLFEKVIYKQAKGFSQFANILQQFQFELLSFVA